MYRRGITLIEMVIYIAIVAILLPTIAFFVVNTTERQDQLTARIHTTQTSALLLDKLRYELQHAQTIHVSGSTLSANPSTLVFTDRNGVLNTITVVDTQKRLRLTQLSTTSWMTGDEISVETFMVRPVRNDDGRLTGLVLDLELRPVVVITDAHEAQIIDVSTSIWLNAYVEES